MKIPNPKKRGKKRKKRGGGGEREKGGGRERGSLGGKTVHSGFEFCHHEAVFVLEGSICSLLKRKKERRGEERIRKRKGLKKKYIYKNNNKIKK